MFADDTALVYSDSDINNLESKINQDLQIYYKWLCINKLTLNAEKTVYMTFKQKNKPGGALNLSLKNVKLKNVTQYKYLGLIIDDGLTWSKHINSILSKIAPMIGVIRRCSSFLNNKTRTMLYSGFIEAHLRYLIPCWGNAGQYLLDKLQRSQNKAIKALYNMNYYTPSVTIYDQTRILNINKLRTFEQTKLIYNIKTKSIKINCELKQANEFHQYNIRQKLNYRTDYARTKKAQDSPIYRSIQTYNTIPHEVTSLTRREKLCHELKTYLNSN